MNQFQTNYNQANGEPITKQDIFYYTYAVLHSPQYRRKYEQNLKREFPRLPFYEDFTQWRDWGAALMDLHINYETHEPFPLERKDSDSAAIRKNKKDKIKNQPLFDKIAGDDSPHETLAQPFTAGTNDNTKCQPVSTGLNESGLSRKEKDVKTPSEILSANLTTPSNDVAIKNLRTENLLIETEREIFTVKPKTKLRADKTSGTIEIDSRATLTNVPHSAWEYKLGNRSALEWILDQYKEKKLSDATIAEHFNAYKFEDYKEQVIDLLKRVTNLSVKTMEIVRQMPNED